MGSIFYFDKEKIMSNKKIWLGMLVMVLAFGMTVLGCEEDTPEEEDKGPTRLEGPLYNIEFWVAEELTAGEESYLSSTSKTNGFGYFASIDGLKSDIGYYAIKVNGKWYKKPEMSYSTNRIFYEFGMNGKTMEKRQYSDLNFNSTLLESKSFEYVDGKQDEIKIDNQVYKYELETAKKENYDYISGGYHYTGTIVLQVLNIYYNGSDQSPTWYLKATKENSKMEASN
jgi:hypothetical protein